jgi:hypothetical protein
VSEDDLSVDGQVDDLGTRSTHRKVRAHPPSGHIGCPLSWFNLVFPVVRGKGELAVALYIYRLRSIRRSRTVLVSNVRLSIELGIDRYTKYRALKRLAQAGVITVRRHNKKALEVVFREHGSSTHAHGL